MRGKREEGKDRRKEKVQKGTEGRRKRGQQGKRRDYVARKEERMEGKRKD